MNCEAAPIDFSVSDILRRSGCAAKFERYFRLVLAENTKINLVSRETNHADLERLTAESLIPFEAGGLESVKSYLDIGSGAGFPAVPILLARSSREQGPLRAVLCERTVKKAAALHRIVQALGVKAEIIGKTLEECSFDAEFDLVTLRYVKLTPVLLKYALSALRQQGHFVYYSRPDFDARGATFHAETFGFTLDKAPPVKSFTVFRKN
jgi:16S rRNA (guanine527-N7)-methyltransferase